MTHQDPSTAVANDDAEDIQSPAALRWDPLQAALGHGQWQWDVPRARIAMSTCCARLLDLDEGCTEVDVDAWLSRAHADDRAGLETNMRVSAQSPDAPGECGFRLAGTARWRLLRATIMARDTAGDARLVAGTLTDISAVGRAVPALHARDRLLDAALEQAQIAWFERDLATDVGIASTSLIGIYGLDKRTGPWHYDEIRARIVPEDIELHRETIAQSLALRTTDSATRLLQYRIRRPDGELRHLEVRFRNTFEGGRGRAFGLIFDVTATKAMELKFEEAMEHARMAWFERDIATGTMRGSRSLWQIYGLDPAQKPLTFAQIHARLHPDDRAAHSAQTDALQARSRALNGEPENGETTTLCYRVQPAPGEQRWLEVRYRTRLDGAGGGTVSGLVVDVTATKRAEAAARDSDHRLRMAMEAAQMASWEWDMERDLVSSRDALGQLFGLSAPSPWPLDALMAAVHPDDLAAIANVLQRARDARGPTELRLELRLCPAGGGERWLEVRGSGGRAGLFGVLLDVTARKHAELERDRLHRQLQQAQKMEAIGLLTGGIAHDFNNILASILGYSGLALQRFSERVPEKLVDYLKEVQIAGGRARDLVSQMLAFSRGESGEMVSISLDRVLDQSLKMLRPTLPATIEITTRVEPGLPPVMADPVQLQQVVLNLCINARDAMAGTGHIKLALAQRRVTRGHCASCHHAFDGDFLALIVSDDGPGIPDSTQARIFEPFFSTKAAGRGTGMGLAMVHGIVHRHLGHVLLDTAADAGCTFAVLVPLDVTDRHSLRGGESVDIASYEASTPTTVLVVDDERAVASFVGELLELNGYTAVVETDPGRAWEMFAGDPGRFDLVITDQTMPRLTGAQLAMRLMGARPNLPVVLMTGYSATIDERRARELGIRAYLRKPVKGDELLATIATALEHKAVA